MEVETLTEACRASPLSYFSSQSGQCIKTADGSLESTRPVCFLSLGEMTSVFQLNSGSMFRLQSVR